MGISIGLTGLGAFGSAFADLFRSHPLVDRVGLCDQEPDRIAQFADQEAWKSKFNPKDVYATHDELCKADFDAIVIITQPWLHAGQALQAMEAGKHVYSAVPVTYSHDGDESLGYVERLIEASRRTGMRYMLGETTYYHPETMYCQRMAAEGKFGEFVFAEGHYFHDSSHGLHRVREQRTSSRSGKPWLAMEKAYMDRGIMNGPMHYPTHSVSGPVEIMKAHAVKVSCIGFKTGKSDPYLDPFIFSDETALFTMSNGAAVRICEFREIGHQGAENFSIYGTEGCYTCEDKGGVHRSHWQGLKSETPLTVDEMREPLPPEVMAAFVDAKGESKAYGGHKGSHAYLVHEFVDAVAHNRQPAINIWQAARYMAMGVTAHKSALRGGELLDVPDWGDAPE